MQVMHLIGMYQSELSFRFIYRNVRMFCTLHCTVQVKCSVSGTVIHVLCCKITSTTENSVLIFGIYRKFLR